MTSNLSGGTNAFNSYFVVKSSSSTLTSPASSHSSASTISEASNASQSTIRTKKPRTTRKRPNQTYNEAASLLSKANPGLFRNLIKKPCKFTKSITERNDSSEPLLPFRACDNDAATSFVMQNKSTSQTEFCSVREKLCSGEVISSGVVNSDELERDSGEDFDCQSILDEEIEEGIDSIMGSRVEDGGSGGDGGGGGGGGLYRGGEGASSCFGRFGGKFGWAGALRHVDGGNCWNFKAVDVFEISPGMKNTPAAVSVLSATERKNKKKRRKEENAELRDLSQVLGLKLNYNDVRNAWSDCGSPFLNNRNMTSLDVSHIPTAFKNQEEEEKKNKRYLNDF